MKLQKALSVVVIIGGIGLIVGGITGLIFTYSSVARENITTPSDASIPDKPVRGPLTLKAQADIIRTHALKSTGGRYYAEISQIPKLDENNNPVLDAEGKPVMVSDPVRNIWVTATTLITALNLGILAYAFSASTIFLGIIFVLIGIALKSLAKPQAV